MSVRHAAFASVMLVAMLAGCNKHGEAPAPAAGDAANAPAAAPMSPTPPAVVAPPAPATPAAPDAGNSGSGNTAPADNSGSTEKK